MVGLQNPAMLGLILAALPVVYTVFKADETEKRVVGVAKIAAILLLAVGAASPYIVASEQLSEQPTVTVLVDESTSTELMEDYSIDFEGVETVQKTIASGNSSELKQGIARNIRKNTPYLVVSDGQSREALEGLAPKFRRKNATLHALKPEMKKDASVTIKGPGSTVLGAENSYTVEIDATNGTPTPLPEVTVDGDEVEIERESEGVYSFTQKFSSERDHTIKASIGINDHFEANNQYFKTVDVTEKPEILVLGEEAGLADELKEFYDLTYRSSVPNDLSDYYAVIAKQQFDESQLASYITEGNGLVYTGDYEEDNEVLPVRKSDDKILTDSTKTIIAIDNSGQLGTEDDRTLSLDVSKSVVASLGPSNHLGLVAYKYYGDPIAKFQEPIPLSRNRGNLISWIDALEPQGVAPHEIGLNVSSRLLENSEDSNIILITDGHLTQPIGLSSRAQETYQIAERLESNLIIIGVGTDQPTNGGERFLREVKRRSGGTYYELEDILASDGTIEPTLIGGGGSGGSSEESSPLSIVQGDHFITNGLSLESATNQFRPVNIKPAGRQLVRTGNGNPALTTWRYGLGRVTAFSAGSKDLGRISANDPELVSRTLSWAVGQPERKEEKTFRIGDARQGENVEAKASYQVEGLKRQGENLYTAELQPESLGFHSYEGELYGYSYSGELEKIGYNEELDSLVESTGGKAFSVEEEEEIISEVKKFSNREIQTEKPLSDYFILAALIVFLSEVGYRKLKGRK